MLQAPFEHFFKMADNHFFHKNKCYFFLYRQHVFVELSLVHMLWMLDINNVHISMIQISVVQ